MRLVTCPLHELLNRSAVKAKDTPWDAVLML